MRRVFPLVLLFTPLIASCSDSATPVAPPSSAVRSEADVSAADVGWPVEENWFTPGDAITLADDDQMVLQSADASAAAANTKPAELVFGNPDVGTTFPGPPGSHDESYHARDRIIPGRVTINAGETVTFNVIFGHRVAIYDDGVQPRDIQRTPGPLLLYPVGRLFLQPNPTPKFTLRFLRPGKYLVLCAITKHFFDANMWGWVHVK